MDLAQNFIEYGTLILEETNSVLRAESRETRALKENDFSLVRFELVSIYTSSCFAIGMLNIIEPSAIEPIADDFFTTMQHIYQFTQTIENFFQISTQDPQSNQFPSRFLGFRFSRMDIFSLHRVFHLLLFLTITRH